MLIAQNESDSVIVSNAIGADGTDCSNQASTPTKKKRSSSKLKSAKGDTEAEKIPLPSAEAHFQGVDLDTPISIGELTEYALIFLKQMISNESIKPADRLSAIKTVLDCAVKLPREHSDDVLHVVFDNIPEEYSE